MFVGITLLSVSTYQDHNTYTDNLTLQYQSKLILPVEPLATEPIKGTHLKQQ